MCTELEEKHLFSETLTKINSTISKFQGNLLSSKF